MKDIEDTKARNELLILFLPDSLPCLLPVPQAPVGSLFSPKCERIKSTSHHQEVSGLGARHGVHFVSVYYSPDIMEERINSSMSVNISK
jgi:hypothetical protein